MFWIPIALSVVATSPLLYLAWDVRREANRVIQSAR
jgi:hypothetical protein